jgi:solute:Na+ symporter, SSS family
MYDFDPAGTGIIIAMVLAYLALTTWLTIKFRSKTSADFMVAARSVPAFVVGVLMMSEFIGAKSTVGAAQTAFESGAAASWAVVSVGIGFPLFGVFLGRKLYSSGEFTISGAVAQKYGRSTQLTVSLIMIYALLLVNVGYYVSGAAAISSVLHLSLPAAAIITAIISTLYCVVGGLKSAAYVSLLHTAVKYIGVFIVLAVALTMTKGLNPMVEKMPAYYFTWDGKLGPSTIVAWIVANVGAIFSTQYIVQAISSLKGPEDVRRSTYIAGALCVPIGIAIGLIGVCAKFLFPEMKSLYALPVFLNHMTPLLSGFVTISLVASVLVGVSSIALGISALVVRDFYVPIWKPSPEAEFGMSRLLTLPIGFLPLIFVFFLPEVLHLSFFTRALRLSIAIVAMTGFYLPFFGSNRGATIGLLAATISTTVWYLLGDPYGIDDIYIALLTPPVAMLFESGFTRMVPKAPTVTQADTLGPGMSPVPLLPQGKGSREASEG